jgi:HAD superfamily hydrolase (TIGR01509 family)
MIKNLKATIFDMDGVLVDSEMHWVKVESELYPNLGVKYNDDFQQDILGLSLRDLIILIQEKYNPKLTKDELYFYYNQAAEKVYKKFCNLRPGVFDFLNDLKDRNIIMTIASSAPQNWIDMMLDRFDLHDMFKYIYSAETMNIPGKPDPAIYNKMITDLGINKDEAVIFEDSFSGFTSALNSGANVVVAIDKRWCTADYSDADLIIESFEDKKLFDFLNFN